MKKFDKLFDDFENAILEPIDRNQCSMFLMNKLLRNRFISTYQYFMSDANSDIYIKYVLDNLNKTSIDLLSDVFDLAIKINYFSEALLEKARKVLHANSHYLLKLSSFDYLNAFFYSFSASDYVNISYSVSQKSSNKIIIFQAYINLIYTDKVLYFAKAIEILKKIEIPSFTYRFIFNMQKFKHLRNVISSEDIACLIDVTNTSNYHKEVIEELTTELQQLSELVLLE